MSLICALPRHVIVFSPTNVEGNKQTYKKSGSNNENVMINSTNEFLSERLVAERTYAEHWSRYPNGTRAALTSVWDAVIEAGIE